MVAGLGMLTVFGVGVTVATLLTRNSNIRGARGASIRSELRTTAHNTISVTSMTNPSSASMKKPENDQSGLATTEAATEAATESEAIVTSLKGHGADIVHMQVARFVKDGKVHNNSESNNEKGDENEGTRESKQKRTSDPNVSAAVVGSTSSGTRVTGSYLLLYSWNDGGMFPSFAISTLMVFATLMVYMIALL
jgi:hypothetical protein